MKNIERHGFSNAVASTEFRIMNNLGPMASWGTQVWIDYCKWICDESAPDAIYIPVGVDQSQVNHPKHYRHKSGLDAIVWIDRYKLDFCEGNCFKYLFREGEKAGQPLEQDEEKAKWYFKHKAIELSECSQLTWDDAKKKVFDKLSHAFGHPGKLPDGSPDWSKGGCDMPEAIEFLKNNCMTLMKGD